MIQIAVTLDRLSSRKDKTMSLGFSTQELSDEDKLKLLKEQGQFGYLLFKPNQFSDKDIPRDDAEYSKNKSPSEKQRAVIYRIWEQRDGKGDFNVYYREYMDKINNYLKSKLD